MIDWRCHSKWLTCIDTSINSFRLIRLISSDRHRLSRLNLCLTCCWLDLSSTKLLLLLLQLRLITLWSLNFSPICHTIIKASSRTSKDLSLKSLIWSGLSLWNLLLRRNSCLANLWYGWLQLRIINVFLYASLRFSW